MSETDSTTMSEALSFTPGVIYEPPYDTKNLGSLSIRGYSHSQIGVFIDGIPMDSSIGVGMFMTQGVSEIQVSKGYTSPLYGPNIMGGAINIVTAKPTKKFQIDLGGGYLSPNGHKEHISLGGNYGRWYYQINLANYMRDYWNLPSGFKPTLNNPTHRRVNSKKQNQSYAFKIAYTPNATDEYAVGIRYDNARREMPVGVNGKDRYWQWPKYSVLTAYAMTNTKVNEKLDINARLYYSGFDNVMRVLGQMENGVVKPCGHFPCKPEDSWYQNYAIGARLLFNVHATKRDEVSVAINVKNDNNLRKDVYKDGSGPSEPSKTKDVTTSVSIEYAHKFDHDVRFILSGSYVNSTVLKAEAFKDRSATTTTSVPKVNLNGWTLQGMVAYAPSSKFDMYISVGKKDNVPSLGARYHTHGTEHVGKPLKTESAVGPEFGFTYSPVTNFHFKAAVYYSLMFNELIDVKYKVNGINVYDTMNSTNSTSKYGVELGFNTDFYRDIFHLMFNYSWTKHTPSLHPDYPENIFNFIAKATPTKNIDLVMDGQWQQAFYGYWGGNTKMPADYFNLSLRAAYRPPVMPGFEIAAGIHNLLDQNIWLNEGFPVEGRNYYIEASYKY